MQFTELDLEFSRKRYDQFITTCSGLGIPATLLFIQLHLFVMLFKFVNALDKSTVNDGGLVLIMVGQH